jgi:hypothetical protein
VASAARATAPTRGGRIDDFEFGLGRAVSTIGIDRVDHGAPRLAASAPVEPLRSQLDKEIGQRANAGVHENHISPRIKPACLGCVNDQSNAQSAHEEQKGHPTGKDCNFEKDMTIIQRSAIWLHIKRHRFT